MSGVVRTIGKIAGAVAAVASVIPGGQLIAGIAGGIAAVASIAVGPSFPPARGSSSDVVITENAPTPIGFGRSYIGGNLIYREGYGNNGDIPNEYQAQAFVYSNGPIDAIEQYFADFSPITFNGNEANGYYRDFLFMDSQLGAKPESNALALNYGGANRWTSRHGLSGYAAALYNMRFDPDGERFAGRLPAFGVVGRWNKCYDIRLDSTYQGGNGSHRLDNPATHGWSQNPATVAMQWVLGWFTDGLLDFGVGLPIDAIITEQFITLANICDANGWTVNGNAYQPDDDWDVLQNILAAGGAQAVWIGGRLGVKYNAPRIAIDTVTEDDLGSGEVSVQDGTDWAARLNTIIPRYRQPSGQWNYVDAQEVAVQEYIDQDGEVKEDGLQFNYVTDVNQAAQLAAYALVNARELGPIAMTLGERYMDYSVGDVLNVDLSLIDDRLNGIDCIIESATPDYANMQLQVIMRAETSDKHEFALGRADTPPPTPALVGGETYDSVAFRNRERQVDLGSENVIGTLPVDKAVPELINENVPSSQNLRGFGDVTITGSSFLRNSGGFANNTGVQHFERMSGGWKISAQITVFNRRLRLFGYTDFVPSDNVDALDLPEHNILYQGNGALTVIGAHFSEANHSEIVVGDIISLEYTGTQYIVRLNGEVIANPRNGFGITPPENQRLIPTITSRQNGAAAANIRVESTGNNSFAVLEGEGAPVPNATSNTFLTATHEDVILSANRWTLSSAGADRGIRTSRLRGGCFFEFTLNSNATHFIILSEQQVSSRNDRGDFSIQINNYNSIWAVVDGQAVSFNAVPAFGEADRLGIGYDSAKWFVTLNGAIVYTTPAIAGLELEASMYTAHPAASDIWLFEGITWLPYNDASFEALGDLGFGRSDIITPEGISLSFFGRDYGASATEEEVANHILEPSIEDAATRAQYENVDGAPTNLGDLDGDADTKLAGIQDNADVTAAAIPFHEPAAQTININADSNGMVLDGQYQTNYIFKRFRGSTNVTSSSLWTIENEVNCSATVSDGVAQLTNLTSRNASFVVRSVSDGFTINTTVIVNRNDAAPSNGVSSTGGTSASSSRQYTTNHIAADGFDILSDVLEVQTGSNGQIDFAVNLDVDVNAEAPEQPSGWGLIAQWEYRLGGVGAWQSAGNTFTENTRPKVNDAGEFFISSTGSMQANVVLTGLNVNSPYQARLVGRINSGPRRNLFFNGPRSAQGS